MFNGNSEKMFDPALYAGVRRAWDTAETLPPWCYTSPEFFERELDRVFRRTWNCIGHTSRVAEPGDYFTLDYARVPLIVVRGKDRKIRAFVNSCRHRNSRVADGSGNCKHGFTCPYHNWSYDTQGRLTATPMFEESDAFKRADNPLMPVRLEIWAELMWINLDPDAPDLHAYLGDLPERVAPYRPDGSICPWRKEWTINANWKLYYENFSEGYHVPFVHKGTLANQKVVGRKLEEPEIPNGEYVSHFTRHAGPRAVLVGDRHFPPMSYLPPALLEGTFYPAVNPASMLAYTLDSMWAVELYPEAPDRTRLACSFMFPPEIAERDDFEEILPNYVKRFEIVLGEDIVMAEVQHKGVDTPILPSGRFTGMDRLVHMIDNWVLDRVIGNRA